MGQYTYNTSGVCSRQINFTIEDGKLHDVSFWGGCHGNLQAIGKLVEGKDARETADLLIGNDCAGRGTSCPDQLARAIYLALEKEEEVKETDMG